ncbi:hypothetical protein CPB97_009584 [Podila verticillata]|nr:hypothetical protein CPB97_009584 [Podila verticillata]
MAALRAMLQLRSSSSSSQQQPASTNSLLSYPDTSPLNSHFYTNSGGILQSSLQQGPGSGLATVSSVGPSGPSSILSSAASTTTMPALSKPAQGKKVLNLGLHSGAACGNLGLVKFALDNGQAIDSVVNGVFPIHAASCSNANIAVVRYLIERGADVNARRLPRKYSSEKGVQTVGTTGSTPLHFAAANGCLAIVEILLRHGAIVDVIDKYGSSPLSVAAARNHPDVASLLHMHSCMQRGVQDMSPNVELKDPFDRRSSGEFGLRLSPTGGRPTTSGHPKDTTPLFATRPHATNATTPTTITTSTIRVAGQRRISLPSIKESPTSPNLTAPRQSCDINRLPHSTEPLVRSVSAMTESLCRAFGTPEPTPSSTFPKQPTPQQRPQPQHHSQKHQGPVLLPAHVLAHSRLELPRSLQRSHTAYVPQRKVSVAQASQGSSSVPTTTENSIKRRRSMESTAMLSPNSALGLSRRKSFDHLGSILRSDSKATLASKNTTVTPVTTTATAAAGSVSATTRRSSDASTSSHATNSSITTADSVETGNTSESALSTPRCSQEGGDFLDKSRAVPLSTAQHLIDSGVASKTSSLTRSISQPCMDKAMMRSRQSRPGPVTFATELETTFGVRPSLDISRLDLNRESERERTGLHVRHQSTPPEKDGDNDDMDLEMPGLFRRKTMQEQGTLPKLLAIPRYHSMGPTMEVMGGSSSPSSDHNHSQSGANSPSGRLSRPSSPSTPRPSSAASGAYSTLSGSATVSSRFARMWSAAQSSNGIKDFSREGSGNGSAGWHVGEFAETTSAAATESLARSDPARGSTRGSMLNRLSGIWSRR